MLYYYNIIISSHTTHRCLWRIDQAWTSFVWSVNQRPWTRPYWPVSSPSPDWERWRPVSCSTNSKVTWKYIRRVSIGHSFDGFNVLCCRFFIFIFYFLFLFLFYYFYYLLFFIIYYLFFFNLEYIITNIKQIIIFSDILFVYFWCFSKEMHSCIHI